MSTTGADPALDNAVLKRCWIRVQQFRVDVVDFHLFSYIHYVGDGPSARPGGFSASGSLHRRDAWWLSAGVLLGGGFYFADMCCPIIQ